MLSKESLRIGFALFITILVAFIFISCFGIVSNFINRSLTTYELNKNQMKSNCTIIVIITSHDEYEIEINSVYHNNKINAYPIDKNDWINVTGNVITNQILQKYPCYVSTLDNTEYYASYDKFPEASKNDLFNINHKELLYILAIIASIMLAIMIILLFFIGVK